MRNRASAMVGSASAPASAVPGDLRSRDVHPEIATYRLVRDLCWRAMATPGSPSAAKLLAAADVRYEVSTRDLAVVPPSGPVLVTANRPCGARDAADRRLRVRYPIDCAVQYQVTERRSEITSGSGRTIDMSSSGILFAAENPVAPGTRIQLWVSWPAKLDHKTPMNLVLRGTVVRTEQGVVAVKIKDREFRIRGTQHSQLFKASPRTA